MVGALFSFVSEVLFLFVGWEPSFSFGVSPGGSVGCCCGGATLWTNKDKQGQTIAYLTRLCIVLLDQLHPSVSVSVLEPVSGSPHLPLLIPTQLISHTVF